MAKEGMSARADVAGTADCIDCLRLVRADIAGTADCTDCLKL